MNKSANHSIFPKTSFYKEAASVMFATPAALTVLSKLDDSSDFLPIIERMILNIRVISADLWQKFFFYLKIDVNLPYDFLTFICLIVLPVIPHSIYSAVTRKSESTSLQIEWSILSIISILYFSLVFDALYFTIMVFGIIYMTGFSLSDHDRTDKVFTIIVSLFAAFLSIIPFTLLENATFSRELTLFFVSTANINENDMVFIFSSIMSVTYIVKYSSKTPAYVALWSIGILVVNWFFVQFVPGIDSYMRSLGV